MAAMAQWVKSVLPFCHPNSFHSCQHNGICTRNRPKSQLPGAGMFIDQAKVTLENLKKPFTKNWLETARLLKQRVVESRQKKYVSWVKL
jgi:hypothetical protein